MKNAQSDCAQGVCGFQIHHWVPGEKFSLKTSLRYRVWRRLLHTPRHMERRKQMRKTNELRKI